VTDEEYEINLKYLLYMYNLLELPGKPHDLTSLPKTLSGVDCPEEPEPCLEDARELHKIQVSHDLID